MVDVNWGDGWAIEPLVGGDGRGECELSSLCMDLDSGAWVVHCLD